MKQVAPYPNTPLGQTLISTELLGKTPEMEIATTPTKVHLEALLGDSIHKVLNLCTYNHNRDMRQATGTTVLSKFADCFLVCKTAFKKVIRNHWTILFDLCYSMHHPPRNDPEKNIVPQPDFLIKSYLVFILHLHPCPVSSERTEVTIQAWQVLCFL